MLRMTPPIQDYFLKTTNIIHKTSLQSVPVCFVKNLKSEYSFILSSTWKTINILLVALQLTN